MEFVNSLQLKLINTLSIGTKKSLDLIENIESQILNLLNSWEDTKNYSLSISAFETQLKSYSPYTLITFGIFLVLIFLLLKKLYKKIFKIGKYINKLKLFFLNIYINLPSNQKKLSSAKAEAKKAFEKSLRYNKYKPIEFRDNKQDYTRILAKMEQNLTYDSQKAKSGKLTGAVYCDNAQTIYIAGEAAKMFLYSNLLHGDLFTYARFLESELVKIGLDLFNGKEDSCGLTTSGGTMSIIHAVYAYVKRGRSLGIKKPELVIPVTAHAAFCKACEICKVKLIKIPLNTKTYQVDLSKLTKAINKNTICIVGSFPNFCHNVYDDIESLSKIAIKYNVPLHVDCCLGGFLVAFHERIGLATPVFDFRLPGVTSISADLHKYGLCPKGISLLMFSKHEYRRFLYFKYPKFLGGIYLTTSFEGSRTAGLIASSYAILTSLGKEHYTNIAKEIYDAVIKVKEFIKNECSLIKVIGDPCICGVSFTGDKKVCEHFYDLLSKKGYHNNYINDPIGVGYIFTSANVANVDNYINDLREIHEKIKKGEVEPVGETCKLYGMAVELPESVANLTLDVLGDCMLD